MSPRVHWWTLCLCVATVPLGEFVAYWGLYGRDAWPSLDQVPSPSTWCRAYQNRTACLTNPGAHAVRCGWCVHDDECVLWHACTMWQHGTEPVHHEGAGLCRHLEDAAEVDWTQQPCPEENPGALLLLSVVAPVWGFVCLLLCTMLDYWCQTTRRTITMRGMHFV